MRLIDRRPRSRVEEGAKVQEFMQQFEGKTEGYIVRRLVQMNSSELGPVGADMLKSRAEQAGMSREAYVWDRRTYYIPRQLEAREIAEEQLLSQGKYTGAQGSGHEDVLSDFDDAELIEQAEAEIYKEFRAHAIQELAGADSGRLFSYELDQNRRDNGIAAGIRHLERKLGMDEEELRRYEMGLLQEALAPTAEQTEKEIIPYVESIVDKVGQDNIRNICKSYLSAKADGDTGAYAQTVFEQIARPLGLEDYGYSLDDVKEAVNDGPNKDDFGRCEHGDKKARIFTGNIYREHPELGTEDFLQLCVEILAHELYHAYEHANSEENDNAVAHRQLLGFLNYNDGDYSSYIRQTVEMSAMCFSSRIYERMRNELANMKKKGEQ